MSIPVSKRAISILIVALCGILIPSASFADTKTRVKLNGKFYPVFFNDGDSFRVLRGDLKDSKSTSGGYLCLTWAIVGRLGPIVDPLGRNI